MSRITYTKKGLSLNQKTREITEPIFSAPLFVKTLWAIGNVIGFNQIKRNAVKNRGYSIVEGKTYTAFNFGKWVAYRRNTNVLPKNDIWYKRTVVNGDYQMTPVSHTNTTMQMIRIPARLV